MWDQVLKMFCSNMPEVVFVWISNMKQVLTPLLERVQDLLQALPWKTARSGPVAGIISAIGVALVGAASSYFAYQKKKLCFKIQGGQDPESGKVQQGSHSDPQASDPFSVGVYRNRSSISRCSTSSTHPIPCRQRETLDLQQTEDSHVSSAAGEAFVTLATTDSYCQGAVVVARSLRRHGTTRHIVVMITPNVSEQSRLALENVFDEVFSVDMMDSKDQVHLSFLGRPELGTTYTKIHCWTLTQYSKCVFLDADTLVLSNVDELFDRGELSAAPDPGWPDCFNSGVFVFRPSLLTHSRLLDHARHHGSFDGGDQGLLNSFFNSWPVEDISKHLPFIYNLCASTVYSYLPAFQQFGHNAKIVHFAGAVKPWSSPRGDSHLMERFASLWWKEYHWKDNHTTPPTPKTQQQQIFEREVEIPFIQNLDTSGSLLAHFRLSDSPHSHTEDSMDWGSTVAQLVEQPPLSEVVGSNHSRGTFMVVRFEDEFGSNSKSRGELQRVRRSKVRQDREGWQLVAGKARGGSRQDREDQDRIEGTRSKKTG
ncbi:glycogenin-1 [Nematolebias whitei]|uniref:glycogenin-1 n=1 Tax=Nematolebias whitei TaxID=451745 RepID=UPI00189BDC81|nr:glycogenin-1 [Nematolebias whitei]